MVAVTVTTECRGLRRQLGPAAWAVLEDVVADAQPDASGHLVAATTVRRLAVNLGLSKDTCARAIGRLVDAALLARVPGARATGGRFDAGAYAINDTAIDALVPNAAIAARPASRSSRSRLKREDASAQAALFDAVGVGGEQ